MGASNAASRCCFVFFIDERGLLGCQYQRPRYAAWAAAGAAIRVMAILNARLARALNGAASATVAVLAYWPGRQSGAERALLSTVPEYSRSGKWPRPSFGGGIIVTLYILSVTLLAIRLGVTNTLLFVVSAQIIAAAVIDDRGFFGASIRPVKTLHLVGLTIVLAGVALSQPGGAAQRQTP
jgi:transporter family-2 protein